LFISFEGTEGTGKTTHCELTTDWLKANLKEKIITPIKRPGGTKDGLRIRELILNPDYNFHPRTIEALFEADFIQTRYYLVKPALRGKNSVLIADRWNGSDFAYKYAEHYPEVDLEKFHERYPKGERPNILIYISFDNPMVGVQRASKVTKREESRIDTKPEAYHISVQSGFKTWLTIMGFGSIGTRAQEMTLLRLSAEDSINTNQGKINEFLIKRCKQERIELV